MSDVEQKFVAAAGIATATVINPWAAVGAFGGCCFFLALPSTADTVGRRFLLSVFSWVMGYGAGAFIYPGPPWSQEAMFVSGAASAMASVIFTALHSSVSDGKDLPPWVLSIIDLVRGRK